MATQELCQSTGVRADHCQCACCNANFIEELLTEDAEEHTTLSAVMRLQRHGFQHGQMWVMGDGEFVRLSDVIRLLS